MTSKFLILFSIVFISILARATVASDCKHSEINALNLPVYPGTNQPDVFEYRYWFKKTSDNLNTPTIIFVPGGPGGTSMNMGFISAGNSTEQVDFLELMLGLPKHYNVILTDPRGRGCNFDSEKPLSENAFRTRYLASDILALIRNLKLKNYILMGNSYGSMLVTEIAARAGKGEAAAPVAVILTGVVGKYFEAGEQDLAFQKEWSRVHKMLPAKVAELFPDKLIDFANSKELPFGISGELWTNFIKEKLTTGTILNAGAPVLPTLVSLLEKTLSQDPAVQMQLADEVSESVSQLDGIADSPIYSQIGCREIFFGEIECQKRNIPMDNPYDSGHWQISSPIYYVQGDNDPNTPPSHAAYHFSAQKNPNRVLITVPLAGHSGMLALSECKDYFWQSVYSGGAHLEYSLSFCSSTVPKIIRP